MDRSEIAGDHGHTCSTSHRILGGHLRGRFLYTYSTRTKKKRKQKSLQLRVAPKARVRNWLPPFEQACCSTKAEIVLLVRGLQAGHIGVFGSQALYQQCSLQTQLAGHINFVDMLFNKTRTISMT
jgi:hypothetical protein